MVKQRKKLGLALGSGGPRGLYHIGVLKTLVKHHIPIDYIAGSSVGSWVGGHYALYKDIVRLEEFTNQRRTDKIFSFMEPSFGKGMIKGAKLKKMLDEWLGYATFRDLQIPFRAVTTDLSTGSAVILKEGNLAFALRASMSLPGIFDPVPYGKYFLTDGGLSNPVPDDIVRDMGADVVLAVNLNNLMAHDAANQKQNMSNVMQKAMDILLYNLSEYSLHDSDIILEPRLDASFGWFDYFMRGIGDQLIVQGARDAARIIPHLKELMALE